MGVDCRINLPGNVRVGDVANVIGKVRGAESKLVLSSCGSYYVDVPDVKVEGIDDMPGCAALTIAGPRPGPSRTLFFFESEGVSRSILLSSTPANIAIAKRLVEFFGGEVDFQDCDTIDCDFARPAKTNCENQPKDGMPWHDLQQRIHAVEPITDDEIEAAVEYAAYTGR